jgi:hypothetical protein
MLVPSPPFGPLSGSSAAIFASPGAIARVSSAAVPLPGGGAGGMFPGVGGGTTAAPAGLPPAPA